MFLLEEKSSKQANKQTKILWSVIGGPKLFNLVWKHTEKKVQKDNN